ncbi:hypothetical protein [Corynebacterium sp.]|uniref:hypothetical protein n=1 Tax=Corynebacterium sp. TaxID=1720 RepID=UPI0026DCB8E9|nr:hypothetical protein [Corynebacterium sp.]MDO5032484.1 hypothetical protein [Corynebacterium sp.]
MRKFRTAAVAAATAVSIAFAGTTVASAAGPVEGSDLTDEQVQDALKEDADLSDMSSALSSKGDASLSSKLGAVTDGQITGNGADAFGSTKNESQVPQWLQIWRDGTFVMVAAAAVSTAVAAYNFAVHQGVIPDYVAQTLKNIVS